MPSPTLDAANGEYKWCGLALKTSTLPQRGQGLFATHSLPAGLLIPYGGVEVSQARMQWLAKHNKDRYVACRRQRSVWARVRVAGQPV